MEEENYLKRFWRFLKKDTWQSTIVTLLIAFVVIKFIVFPLLSFATGTVLPLVIVESCSMYHSGSWEDIFASGIYNPYNLGVGDAQKWSLGNGFTKGDIIFVVSAENLEVGDVIIFNGGQANPIIHRVIDIQENGGVTTKGDHNNGLLSVEKRISQEQILGKAVFRVPALGWVKLIFFDWMKPAGERGLCT